MTKDMIQNGVSDEIPFFCIYPFDSQTKMRIFALSCKINTDGYFRDYWGRTRCR